jgi:hypothetical protein
VAGQEQSKESGERGERGWSWPLSGVLVNYVQLPYLQEFVPHAPVILHL